MDSNIPSVTVYGRGECNYCSLHDKWEETYTLEKLDQITAKMRKSGSRYDCLVGVSGGCDSSYVLYWAKRVAKLRPLAVHWNNGWNTEFAESNMRKMVNALNVDYFEMGVDREEYDDLCKSFLLASVPDADIPNDIALTTVLYYAAQKFRIKHIINGHSFRTEGTVPLEWSYMDGRYVESVQQMFGSQPLDTFPNLLLGNWLRWLTISRIKRVRPLWYVPYHREKAKKFLSKQFGWHPYRGHHQENRYTMFVSNHVQPIKFGIDLRLIRFAARVRSGQMSRAQALTTLSEPPTIPREIVEEVKERLGFTDEEFEQVMRLPKKTHHDYETYHGTFKRYRWLFWMLAKLNLVPQTFYVKYTK